MKTLNVHGIEFKYDPDKEYGIYQGIVYGDIAMDGFEKSFLNIKDKSEAISILEGIIDQQGQTIFAREMAANGPHPPYPQELVNDNKKVGNTIDLMENVIATLKKAMINK